MKPLAALSPRIVPLALPPDHAVGPRVTTALVADALGVVASRSSPEFGWVELVSSAGAVAAPPHDIKAPAVPADEDAHAEALEKYGMPPLVPATVRASVPEVVIGDPATEIRPPVKLWATLVTVPDPPPPPPCTAQVLVDSHRYHRAPLVASVSM